MKQLIMQRNRYGTYKSFVLLFLIHLSKIKKKPLGKLICLFTNMFNSNKKQDNFHHSQEMILLEKQMIRQLVEMVPKKNKVEDDKFYIGKL